MNRRTVVIGKSACLTALCVICAFALASVKLVRHRNSPGARFNRQIAAGNVYFKSGNFQQAVVEYSKLITLQPNRSEGYILRAMAYRKLGEYEKAIADNSSVINMNPSSEALGDARYNLAMVYAARHDFKLALAEYDILLGSVPNTTGMISGRAACYRLQGDPTTGVVQTEIDYRTNTPKFGMYINRGNYDLYEKQNSEAESQFKLAVAVRPCDPVGWTNLAWAQFLEGDVERAEATDKTAIGIDPTFSISRFNMGLYYAVQNRWDDAKSQYLAGLQTASRSSMSNGIDDIDSAKKRFTAASSTLEKAQSMMQTALNHAPIYTVHDAESE